MLIVTLYYIAWSFLLQYIYRTLLPRWTGFRPPLTWIDTASLVSNLLGKLLPAAFCAYVIYVNMECVEY